MKRVSLWIAAAALVGITSAMSAVPLRAQTDLPADKPFADHRIALQLSDKDQKKQTEVLNVANNLLKAYGPDTVAVEVVAFGPGIDLLRAENVNRARVDSLVSQGVRFNICGNTLDTIERETGKRPKVNPKAVEVQVGVGYLLTLAEKGYTIVRP
jgi:intracellular sulfur oxidation DsrE/DsrF family protein